VKQWEKLLQTDSYHEECGYNTGVKEFQQTSCQWNFETEDISCQKLERSQTTTFEQFKKALAEYYEDFTVGYQEQPAEQDLKDLYEDFLEFGKSLDEYLKDC